MYSEIYLAMLQSVGFWAAAVSVVYCLGILNALHALMTVRTSQGTIAWAIALLSLPLVAIPLYWVFGRNKFHGYRQLLRQGQEQNQEIVNRLVDNLSEFVVPVGSQTNPFLHALNGLTRNKFIKGNEAQLLIDGAKTFDSIFAAIEQATDYVLVQFFIIKDDDIGRELKRRLIAKSRDGVRCFVLYDEIGSLTLPQAFIDELRQSGVEVEAFKTTKGFSNRFQINFRNHRKIVIADGKVAFVGGHNVGDEYLGRDKNFGRWRDTHVRLVGPVVLPIQIVFLQDWYWATERLLEVNLDPELSPEGDIDVLTLPSAPVDEIEACTLFFLTAINNAQEKLWIASPYFVPDEAISTALQMAALRGVDVRILIPSKPDHLMVYLAAFSYLQEMEIAGVKVFRYESGFLHQKVLLVDDTLASVGTANLDNRSFRLNFEISMVFANQRFVKSVESMLLDDFDQAVLASYDDYQRRWLGFKFGVRVARLLSPIL